MRQLLVFAHVRLHVRLFYFILFIYLFYFFIFFISHMSDYEPLLLAYFILWA